MRLAAAVLIMLILLAILISRMRADEPVYPNFPDVVAVEQNGLNLIVVGVLTGDGGRSLQFMRFEDNSIGVLKESDICAIFVDQNCNGPALTEGQREQFQCWAGAILNADMPEDRFDWRCVNGPYIYVGSGSGLTQEETAERLATFAENIRANPMPWEMYKSNMPVVVAP
jgi:hypothetical protein